MGDKDTIHRLTSLVAPTRVVHLTAIAVVAVEQNMPLWKPTINELAREMITDLPVLFEETEAVTLSYLCEYYGDTYNRIRNVVDNLEQRGKVVLKKKANLTYYITLPDTPLDLSQELTRKQRELVEFVKERLTQAKAEVLKTNYAHLSIYLYSSRGGMKIRVKRCVDLGYLVIENPSMQGKQDSLILSLGPKAKDEEHE